MKISVVNNSKHPLPEYQTAGAAGFDIRANLDAPITLEPHKRVVVPTGLHMAIPEGYEVQIRSRSGLAAKYGVAVLNSPGTIDSDYRGDIGVILVNHSDEPFIVNDGDRVAQIVVARFERAELVAVEELDETERGHGGFGHTGR
jgi:dUTP pyrophosphatase